MSTYFGSSDKRNGRCGTLKNYLKRHDCSCKDHTWNSKLCILIIEKADQSILTSISREKTESTHTRQVGNCGKLTEQTTWLELKIVQSTLSGVHFHSRFISNDTFYLRNRESALTPTSDIGSYRMRRSKKLIIQGTRNGRGVMTVQKNQNERKEQSIVHTSSATR